MHICNISLIKFNKHDYYARSFRKNEEGCRLPRANSRLQLGTRDRHKPKAMLSFLRLFELQKHTREARDVHDYIKERTIKIGRYIVETRKTVRTIAKEFGVSKSTVHKDLTERLPEINPELASEVKKILEYHKSVRHLRGGEATKVKYSKPQGGKQDKKELESKL